MPKPFIEPGPIPGTVINSPGELDAMVSGGQPGVAHGMTYRGATTPDIATYSIYENFLWIDTSGPRIIRRHYNTATFAWDAELPADGSITGDMIADNTITLAKLYATPGLGGYVLRLNGASTAVVWDAPANLFGADEFPIVNLEYSAVGSYVLSSNGTTNSWATVISLIADGSIAFTKLSTTGAVERKVLAYYSAALGYQYVETLLRDNTTPINKLELGSPNALVSVNAAGTSMEYRTISQLITLLGAQLRPAQSTPEAVPAAGSSVSVNHGLGSTPSYVEWRLICITAEFGFVKDQEVPISQIYTSATGNESPSFNWGSDSATLTCTRNNYNSAALLCARLDTGAQCTLTATNWNIKVYYAL